MVSKIQQQYNVAGLNLQKDTTEYRGCRRAAVGNLCRAPGSSHVVTPRQKSAVCVKMQNSHEGGGFDEVSNAVTTSVGGKRGALEMLKVDQPTSGRAASPKFTTAQVDLNSLTTSRKDAISKKSHLFASLKNFIGPSLPALQTIAMHAIPVLCAVVAVPHIDHMLAGTQAEMLAGLQEDTGAQLTDLPILSAPDASDPASFLCASVAYEIMGEPFLLNIVDRKNSMFGADSMKQKDEESESEFDESGATAVYVPRGKCSAEPRPSFDFSAATAQGVRSNGDLLHVDSWQRPDGTEWGYHLYAVMRQADHKNNGDTQSGRKCCVCLASIVVKHKSQGSIEDASGISESDGMKFRQKDCSDTASTCEVYISLGRNDRISEFFALCPSSSKDASNNAGCGRKLDEIKSNRTIVDSRSGLVSTCPSVFSVSSAFETSGMVSAVLVGYSGHHIDLAGSLIDDPATPGHLRSIHVRVSADTMNYQILSDV